LSALTFDGYVVRNNVGSGSYITRTHLESQFSRIVRTLRLIAGKVLSGDEGVDEAIANSFATASRTSRAFDDERELRRWLVRLAVDESLLILRRREKTSPAGAHFRQRPQE
jgi:hypothetical protein